MIFKFRLLTPCKKIYNHASTLRVINLEHINTLLHQAVATCKAAKLVYEPPQTPSTIEFVPLGKSLERQWRFVKTTKQEKEWPCI